VAFLKRLFGGGSGAGQKSSDDPNGMYFYVQPRGCEEIVRIRINMMNDLSQRDEGGYWVHKVVRGTKCLQSAELDVYFDDNRRFKSTDVKDGAVVDAAVYTAWQEAQN
jgi:hypothetical protein